MNSDRATEYFSDIKEIEERMIDYYSELSDSLSEGEVRKEIEKIRKDEMKHRRLVSDLIKKAREQER